MKKLEKEIKVLIEVDKRRKYLWIWYNETDMLAGIKFDLLSSEEKKTIKEIFKISI